MLLYCLEPDMKVLRTYYNSDGVLVKVYATAAPRPSERTWRGNEKYSVAHIGRKQITTGSKGVF
jgi:hypothetical protein